MTTGLNIAIDSFLKERDVVFLLDGDGHITYVSNAIESYGYIAEDLLGKHMVDFIHPEDRQNIELLKKQRVLPRLLQLRFFAKNNASVIFEIQLLPSFAFSNSATKAKKDTHLPVLARNLTTWGLTAEALKNSEEKYRKLFELSPLIKIVFRIEDGIIIEANHSFAELVGMAKANLIGHDVRSFNFVAQADYFAIIEKMQRAKKFRRMKVQLSLVNAELRTILFSGELIKINFSSCCLLVGLDVTAQRQTRNRLKERQQQLKTLMDNLSFRVWIKSTDGKYLSVNKAFEEAMNGTDVRGLTDYQIYPLGLAKKYCEEDSQIVDKKKSYKYIEKTRQKGKARYYEVVKNPILNMQQEVIGITGSSREITETLLAQRALQKSEKLYRSFIEETDDLVISVNRKGQITFANNAAIEMLELPALVDEIYIPFFSTKEQENLRTEFENLIKARKTRFTLENKLVSKRGKASVIMWKGSIYYNAKWCFSGINAIGRDITERNEMENKLIASLKEKEILLKEIHHRVKNNLQIVSSLINLQTAFLQDESAKQCFVETQNRLRTIALIHEKIYHAENISSLRYDNYIKSLCDYLQITFLPPVSSAKIEYNLEAHALDLEQAIPASLILNELVANAFKYGLKENKLIEIGFRLVGEDYEISVKDYGPGLPANFDYEKTFGIRLIIMLLEQLEGRLEYNKQDATIFKALFPRVKK